MLKQKNALAALGLTGMLVSCGGTSTGSTTPPQPERRGPQLVLRADVTPPAIPTLELPLRANALMVMRGGRRLVMDDAGVHAAALDFASPILGAAEREGEYLFVTADGAYYRVEGDDPLGTPSRIGELTLPRLSNVAPSRGRLAVLAGDIVGDLYTSVGGEFVRAELPPRSVSHAVFTDEEHGCALLFDGTGRATDDGGASYHYVPGLERAYALDYHDGQCRFHVGSADEPTYQTLDERGRAIAYEPEDDDDRDGVYPYRAAELFLARGTMGRIGRERAVALASDPTSVHVFDLTTGERLGTYEDVLPQSCSLVDAGRAVVAFCTPADDDATALYTRDGQHWEPLAGLSRALGIRGAQVYGSDDGQLAWTGPCEDDPAIASEEDTICVLRDLDSGAHASVMISSHGTSLIHGIAGDYLLLEAQATERFWLAHLGTEETIDVDIPGARRIVDVELASDGTLVVIAEETGGARVIHLGPPGGELARRTIPEGAVDASFQTDANGVAAGRSMREIFRTRDGGQTWSPMRVMLEGEAERTPLLDPERYLECHASYCLGFSWRGGRGRAFVLHPVREDAQPTTLGAIGPDRLGDEPTMPLSIPTLLRCEVGEALPAPTRPALARNATSKMYGDGNFLAWVDEIPRGRRTAHQIHWRGRDSSGEYQASSRVADSNAPRGSTLYVSVVTAARPAAVLNLCMTTPERIECRLAIVRPNEVPIAMEGAQPHFASHGSMVASFSPRELFYLAMRLPSGPVVHLLDPADLGGGSFDVGANVGDAFVGLASTSLGSYFVLTDRAARLWQAVVETETVLGFPPVAAIRENRISACRGNEPQASVRWPTDLRLRIGEETVEGKGFATIALSQTAPCLANVNLSSDPFYGHLEADAEGRMIGPVERDGALVQTTCTLR